jgi:hypothetical protein
MDLHLASTVIRTIAENAHRYSPATQLTLLEGVLQLTDECHDRLKQMSDRERFENVSLSLDLVRCLVDDSFRRLKLADGFRLASECFPPEVVMPPRSPK